MKTKKRKLKTPILINAASMASRFERTFKRDNTKEVTAGWFVKVCVMDRERFWVKVASRKGDLFTGVVDNDLVTNCGLEYGDRIQFHVDNIYNVMSPEDVECKRRNHASA